MEEFKKQQLICLEDFGSDDDDDSGESGFLEGSSLPASLLRVSRAERRESGGSSSSATEAGQPGRGLRYMNFLQLPGVGHQAGSSTDQVDNNMALALNMKQKLSLMKSELNKKSEMLLKVQNDLIQRNSDYTSLQTGLERSKNEIDLLKKKLHESNQKNLILSSQMLDLRTEKEHKDDEEWEKQVAELKMLLQEQRESFESIQNERDELLEKVDKMGSLLQKVEKGILEKIQQVQKPEELTNIGLTPQGEAVPDLWRRVCLLERELTACKNKNENLKHKLQKRDQRYLDCEKRISELQAELKGKDLNLQHTEANLKQLQARVKWYSEILHKKEEQLSKLTAEKKEREVEKVQVKTPPIIIDNKDKSKLEFALNKPNIFDILKKQLSVVPPKRKGGKSPVKAETVTKIEDLDSPNSTEEVAPPEEKPKETAKMETEPEMDSTPRTCKTETVVSELKTKSPEVSPEKEKPDISQNAPTDSSQSEKLGPTRRSRTESKPCTISSPEPEKSVFKNVQVKQEPQENEPKKSCKTSESSDIPKTADRSFVNAFSPPKIPEMRNEPTCRTGANISNLTFGDFLRPPSVGPSETSLPYRPPSFPSFSEHDSAPCFGDLLPPTNFSSPVEIHSDSSCSSRAPSVPCVPEPRMSTPLFTEQLSVPNVAVKQELMEIPEQTPAPVPKPYIKPEPMDPGDLLGCPWDIGEQSSCPDKPNLEDPFQDSLLQLKSLLEAQSLPPTPNDMNFSSDSNSGFGSPIADRNVQNFINGDDDENLEDRNTDVKDSVDGKEKGEEGDTKAEKSEEDKVEYQLSNVRPKTDDSPPQSLQEEKPEEDSTSKEEKEKEFTWSAAVLEPANRVECNVCGKMFLTEELLESHKRWHRQQNHCRECGKTFLWQFQLSLHMHEQHGIKGEGENETEEKSELEDKVEEPLSGDEVAPEEEENAVVSAACSDVESFMDEDSDADSVEESVVSGNFELEDEFTSSELESAKSETGSVIFEPDAIVFMCKICSKTFRNKHALSMHSSVHTGFGYICRICGKGYKLDIWYKQHLSMAHGIQQAESDDLHRCEYCEKTYKTAVGKREHILTTHPGQKNFKCNICSKLYHSFSKKQKHMIKSHPAWAPFMCQICRSTYNTSKALMQHIQEQHGSRAAEPIVPRKHAFQRMLKRYMTDPLPCPPPAKQQVTSTVTSPLKLVIRTISKEPEESPPASNLPPDVKPEPVFVPRRSYSAIECDVCNLSFSFIAGLKFHMMSVHPSDTMHECKRCSMVYSGFRNLQAHKKIHNASHRCYHCRKTFPKKSALQNHVKTHFPELKGLNLLLKPNRKRRIKVVKPELFPPWI